MLSRIAAIGLFAAVVFVASRQAFDATTALRHLFIAFAAPLAVWTMIGLHKKGATEAAGGWRRLSPSAMNWAGLVLSFGLTGFMLYIWLFVGSSRPDGAFQMKVLLGLIVAGTASTLYMLAECFLVCVRWNGERIERRLGPWLHSSIAWDDIAGVESFPPDAPLVLKAKDGSRLYVDAGLSLPEELVQRLDRWLPSNPSGALPA